MKIEFSPPDISDLEIEEVVDTLKSGWLTTGPKTKELERRIADYVGVKKAVCLNSATAALELALILLGIGEGDEVITCAYTYTASASVIHHVGAKIVLVDMDKDSFQMDYEALERALTRKTKAVIPVDIAGVPCDYDRIFEILERKKSLFHPKNEIQKSIGRVAVVEDAAHAFGGEYKGKKIGSIADFTAFSFHAVKNFTTGEGGAVTWNLPGTDEERIYKELMLWSLHGQNKDALAKTKLGAWEYEILYPGYKCNMTDILASLGLAQMKRYEGLLKRRDEIVKAYTKAFEGTTIHPMNHYPKEGFSTKHLYIVNLEGKTLEERNDVIVKMAQKGVACNVHYKPLPYHGAYKKMGFDIQDYPEAFCRYQNVMTLPLHTKLSDEEVEYISSCLKEIVK